MATKKKITRKELKEPDEFVSTTTEIYRYVLDNWKYFLSGLIAAVIIVGAGFIWRAHVIKRETEAFNLYHSIQLETQKTKGKTETSSKICDAWDKLERKFSGTPAAIYGLLQKSSCLLAHQDYKKSGEAIQKLLSDTKSPAVVRVLSLLLKGYALEEKKSYKEAEEVFKSLLEDPDNFLRDTVRYHLYICQLHQGKMEAAKVTLSGIRIMGDSDFALPIILVKIEKAKLGIKE